MDSSYHRKMKLRLFVQKLLPLNPEVADEVESQEVLDVVLSWDEVILYNWNKTSTINIMSCSEKFVLVKFYKCKYNITHWQKSVHFKTSLLRYKFMFSVSNSFYSHFRTFKTSENLYTLQRNSSSSEHRHTLVVEPKNEQLHVIVDYEHVLW